MKNKITLLNVITSLILQFSLIISGFIIPKIILLYFGSEVNGLISSINQFLSYISLLEGGVSSVITASLYKPLVEKNEEKISSIIKTANMFYKKIGIIFIVYSIIIAGIYPILFKISFSYLFVFTLTMLLSLNLLIQYMFSITYKTLLIADKQGYIVSITQTIMIIFNVLFAIISVKIYPNVLLIKMISGVLFLVQPIVFTLYVNKKYKLNNKAKVDNSLLKNRWDGFAINIAAFVHSCTDITILTIFTNLQTVSIYSVYALVSTGLKAIITSISNGINPTLGHKMANKNKEELKIVIDNYEYIIFILVYISFTVASFLVVPFVLIYTNGVNDANYNQPIFGILLLISEALYLLKTPHLNTAYSANKFKEITKPAFIEALLNIIISIVLVSKLKLIGIMIGTIVGMTYRMIFHINFTKTIVKDYEPKRFYYKFILFNIVTILYILICHYCIPIVKLTIIDWIWHGIIYLIVALILFGLLSILFFRKNLKFILKYLKH